MRQVNKCNNKVAEAKKKGPSLLRERECGDCLLFGGRTQQKYGRMGGSVRLGQRKRRGGSGALLISFKQHSIP